MASYTQIDVKELLRSKNPLLLKILPGFIIKYIMRIIHQNEVNAVLQNYSDDMGVAFVNNTLNTLGVKYEMKGTENLPKNGRYLFAGNHPLGGLDGLIMISAASQFFSNVKFVVNDLLMNLPNLAPVFIPINKHGKQSVEYARILEEAYASDGQILYFPAGMCSRKTKGKIIDLEWKKSFITKTINYKRDIIPVHFDGQNSQFFYNLSNYRKWLGIKANIEMFYLVDEMFNQRSKSICITFGKPIPFTTFDKRHSHFKWASLLRNHVYKLKNNPNTPFLY